jgi:2-polyprenyl-6-methoxyphenol hydroxylase-like FAD-dependent oxidoreductase
MEVAVIGGGIGGLTTALALTRQGIGCTVYERAPELQEIGAGLGIWPAPLRVFDKLGIGDAVRELSGPWDHAGLRRWDGTYLVRYTADEFADHLGEPTIGVHRGELQALLLRSLPEGVVRVGSECIGLASWPAGVTISLADGQTIEAEAVIAADGRRSAVRDLVFGKRTLHDCKSVGWRGTAFAPEGSDWHRFAGESWGPAGRFGILPISGGRVTWYAAARRYNAGGDLAEVMDRFGSWHHPIPSLIAATGPDDLWRDSLDDLRPLLRWTQGRVALLGDAAHPMTPDLGQGACQAILDAWVVAEELASQTSVPDALRVYERRRRRRAAMVSLVARGATTGARFEGRLSVALRSRVAALGPPSVMLRQLAFIARGP